MSSQYNVKDFGAKGDGVTLDTEAIQRTIDACAAAGGGTVLLPTGTYLCSTFYLKSRMTFEVGPGAVLLGSKTLTDYAPFTDREFCRVAGCAGYFIRGIDLEDVAICGPGVIDGNEAVREDGNRGPMTILFEDCRNVTVRDVTIIRAPGWCTTFVGCDDVRILRVNALDCECDGINIVGCRRVLYDGCVIDTTHDDPLCIKNEGRPADPRRHKYNSVTEDVIIANTVIRNTTHPAIKIGTATPGVFRNILVSNCIFENVRSMFTIQLMRPKLEETKERIIENVMFSNVTVRDAHDVFDITAMSVDEAAVSDLVFDNLLVSGMRSSSKIRGTEQVSISNVAIKNSRFVHTERSLSEWLSCAFTKNLTVRDVTFDLRAPLDRVVALDRTDGFIWDRVDILGEAVRDCVIATGNSSGAEIRGCTAKDVDTYLRVDEGGLTDIRFLGNDLQDAREAFLAGWKAISGHVRPLAEPVSSAVVAMDREVDPGTALEIQAELQNGGGDGVFLLKVTEDGRTLGGRWVYLGPGARRTVAFETEPIYRSGGHRMVVGGVRKTLTVREAPCELAHPGPLELRLEEGKPEAAWVKVPVQNVGGHEGRAEVTLDAAGHAMTKEVSLEPGESSFVTFDDFKGVSSILPLRVADYPLLEYYTYANTDGRFFYHHDGRIEIHAGGERGTFEQHAVVYLPRIAGDYTAVCRLVHQDSHTGEYASAGLIARNAMRDDLSAGHAKYHRVIKYSGFMLAGVDGDGDGKLDDGGGGQAAETPVWLKLERRGNDIRASISEDGEHWEENQVRKGGKRRLLRGHFVLKNTADTQDVGVFGLAYGSGISKVILEDFSVTRA